MKCSGLICRDYGGTLWSQINIDIIRNFKYLKKKTFFEKKKNKQNISQGRPTKLLTNLCDSVLQTSFF